MAGHNGGTKPRCAHVATRWRREPIRCKTHAERGSDLCHHHSRQRATLLANELAADAETVSVTVAAPVLTVPLDELDAEQRRAYEVVAGRLLAAAVLS